MATQPAPKKILRLGVIQNGRIIEERLIRNPEPVTAGQAANNALLIASDTAPQHIVLFDLKNGAYLLNYTDAMGGRVAIKDTVVDLAAARQSGAAKKTAGGYALELDERSRGKVSVGDATVLFQFVNAPPLKVLPQLPANMRGNLLTFLANVTGLTGAFLAIFLFCVVSQGGGIGYLVLMVPPPPRTASLAEVPDRFVQIMRPEPEPEEPPPVTDDSAAEATGEGVPTDEPAEQAQAETDEPSNNDSPDTRTQDVIREEARQTVREQSALGALYASDSGVGPALAVVTGQSNRTVTDVLNGNIAAGAGGGIVSSTGLGTSQGAEGTVDRAQISGGGSQVAANAEVAQNTEVAGVEVRVDIRSGDARTAGSGSIDSSSLSSVMRQRQRDIQRCYERGLARDPELSGRFMLEFTIGSDGRVTDARLPTNELGEDVGTCIVGAVRRWRFDAPDGGEVTVRRPYILASGG